MRWQSPDWTGAKREHQQESVLTAAVLLCRCVVAGKMKNTSVEEAKIGRSVERWGGRYPKEWLSRIATVRVRVGSPDPLRFELQQRSRLGGGRWIRNGGPGKRGFAGSGAV